MCDLTRLADKFAPDDLEWRIQQAGKKGTRIWAKAVAYVDNRAIMRRLDEVCGVDGWRNEYAPGPDGGVLCGLSIRCLVPDGPDGEVRPEWITKWDGAENTTGVEGGAVKGGLSSAMKRAAVQWGLGRYLYQLDSDFANVSDSGANFGRLPSKAGGDSFRWDPPQLPGWAIPSGKGNGKPAQDRGKPSDTKDMGQSQDRGQEAPDEPEPPARTEASARQIEALRELAIDQSLPAPKRKALAEALERHQSKPLTGRQAGALIGKARRLVGAAA